ncbi:MAG: PAS domain-containing sensor histidine kinase [Arcobacteraceae bacterium]
MPHTNISKSNQVLKEVINNSWSGIGIIDIQSKFIYVNDAFNPILGYSESELLQIKFEDLLTEKYKVSFQKLILENQENQYNNSIRVQCVRKDNALVYLDISIKFMSNKKHIVINVNDITQNISDHETFDKYVIQAHVDKNGIINKVSEAFCRLTLYSSEELLGQHYSFMYHCSLNMENLDIKIANDLEQKFQYNGIIATKNKYGDTFWVDIIIKPIQNKYGDIIGYSAVMFDMTNEISLQKNTVALEETIGENEVKLQIMGETLRTVAHQWRQPLNNISLEAQDLLLTYQFSDELVNKDEAVPILESMRDNIEGLSQIISKFQLITEIKSAKTEVKMPELITRAFSKSIIDKNIVNLNIEENIIFHTYENELVTSVVSIFDNACEAVEKLDEGVEKKIFLKTYVNNENKNLYIEISNNGGHIKDGIIDKIFDAYFSTKLAKNGLGLSLYISKIIVELHLNGKIEVENKNDDIVTFTIILPIGIKNDNNTSKIK